MAPCGAGLDVCSVRWRVENDDQEHRCHRNVHSLTPLGPRRCVTLSCVGGQTGQARSRFDFIDLPPRLCSMHWLRTGTARARGVRSHLGPYCLAGTLRDCRGLTCGATMRLTAIGTSASRLPLFKLCLCGINGRRTWVIYSHPLIANAPEPLQHG